MRKIKVIVANLLVFSLFFGIFNIGVLAKDDKSDKAEWEKVIAKHNVQKLDKIPDGVQPAIVNTIEEFEKIVEMSKNPIIEERGEQSEAQISPMASGSAHWEWLWNLAYVVTMDVSYEYLYDSNRGCNYYSSCTDVRSGGFGHTYDWTPSSYLSNIYDNGLTLTANVTGIMKTYLLTPVGFVCVATETITFGHNFTNP